MNSACPCCKQAVTAPSLEGVIEARRLDGFEASILSAVWAGKGRPVQTGPIFDAMYSDDPDGGPSPTRMYAAFKVALHSLNSKLNGTGIAIRSAGYRKGFRISFTVSNGL